MAPASAVREGRASGGLGAREKNQVNAACKSWGSLRTSVALGVVLGWGLTACGGQLSPDERWDSDDDEVVSELEPSGPTSSPSSSHPAPADLLCEAAPIYGYHYAEPGEFWLGSQAEAPLVVVGQGYFSTRDADATRPLYRYATQALISVAPDGSLEDHGGHALLGYPPGAIAGGPCLSLLQAPVFSAPQPTSFVTIGMNLDPREQIVYFDLLDPSATSNGSTSFGVIDSFGASRWVDLYFNNLGGNFYEYHVLVDGSDIAGGVPGVAVDLSQGWLQFNSDGALDVDTTPQFCASFAGGATASQCISVDFGTAIAEGGTGLDGSTQFATYTVVHSMLVDGFTEGTGTGVNVGDSGEVTVEYDSGAELVIGRLALARFPNEDQLAVKPDGSFRATVASGDPQFGVPLGAGRGSLE